MKKIGMLVAVELESMLGRYPLARSPQMISGFPVYTYDMGEAKIFAIHSGAGEIAAAAATQLLLTALQVEAVVNYGVVGGLTEEMALTRTCVVEKVVHYDFDTSGADGCPVGQYEGYPNIYLPTSANLLCKALQVAPTLKPVICASGDKFIDKAQEKRRLHAAFGADICDMESAAIVLTCNRAQIPCLLIKTVSDSITGGAEEFNQTILQASNVCLAITEQIIQAL